MSEPSHTPATRRIQVAMDTSPLALLAVEMAAQLAGELRSDLEGVFYEDIQLLRLSGLPFIRETGSASAVVRSLSPMEMERRLQAKADEVRRTLARQCSERKLSWSLTTLRERAVHHALRSARNVDLLVIGVQSRQPRASILWRESRRSARPVVVVLDGSEAGRRAFEIGKLATRGGSQLVILPVAGTDDEAQRLGNEVLQEAPHALLHPARVQSVGEIAQIVQSRRGELLIIPWELSVSDESSMETLVDALDCLVVLVR